MKVKYKCIPQDIKKYNLDKKLTSDDHMHVRIIKGVPGLKQAVILAYEHLQSCIEPYGYFTIPVTVGLWKH